MSSSAKPKTYMAVLHSVLSFVDDVLLDLLLGVSLVWVLPHLQWLVNHYSVGSNIPSVFWEGLWMEINNYPLVYFPFAAFLVWWFLSRGIQRWKDRNSNPSKGDKEDETVKPDI